jgi:hypothetical protein
MPWLPDPLSRQQVAGEVVAIAGQVTVPPLSDPKLQLDLSGDVPEGPIPSPEAAFYSLHLRFLSWEAAQPRLLDDVQQTPRLSDVQARAEQLGQLAAVGLSTLAYLESRAVPPAGWHAQQCILAGAAQPSALVRFTVLYSMRKLVAAAAQTEHVQAP